MNNEVKIRKDRNGEITYINDVPVHPMANIVPLDEDLTSLMISINDQGLIHPVLMYKGKIIDGRRRTMACIKLGIVPDINELSKNGDYSEKELMELVIAENATRRNLSTSQKAIIAAKQTISGKHKLTQFKNSKEYAKKIWGISENTLFDARWLVKNHKEYSEEIFENGFVIVDDKKWRGVNGLVKILKAKLVVEEKEEAGREDYAIAYVMIENALNGTKNIAISNIKRLEHITPKKAEEIFYEKAREMFCEKNPFIEALKK
jgi:hypothetical protein